MATEDKYYQTPSAEKLTTREEKRRKQLERQIIEAESAYYINQGKALQEICRKRLYRSTHSTFADYSQYVLDITPRRAYQLVSAADVVDNLKFQTYFVNNCSQKDAQRTEITLPANEATCRALAILKPEQQLEAWEMALKTAPDGKMTAEHARIVARSYRDQEVQQKIQEVKDKAAGKGDDKSQNNDKNKGADRRQATEPRIGESFRRRFDAMLSEIQKELKSGWRKTDRMEIVKYLDGIKSAILETSSHKTEETVFEPEQDNIDKLLAAGFEIYRLNKEAVCIEKYHQGHGFLLFQDFKDQAEMKTAFEEIQKSPKALRG